ncbi:MAG: adenylyltransferase/cytidyltransferase family protein [Candidatus Paceibacterota bacterium]
MDIKKKAERKLVKIMVFGTFDGLHEGHINFFKQAKNFIKNSFLIASIARDKNVLRIKGVYPDKNERERMILVKKCKLIDKVVLSGLRSHLPHIVKIHPDIIALGYDQKAYVKNLKKDLKNNGIWVKVIRLKPFREKIYKNHLLKRRV